MSSPITNVPTSGNLSMRLRHIIDNIDHIYKQGWKLLTWAIQCVRALQNIVCILGKPHCYDNLSQKWPKTMTTVHLSTDSSETEVVSSLKKAYSREGIPTLNVASKVEFFRSLSTQYYSPKKSKKQKWPIFHSKDSASIKKCLFHCACHSFVAVVLNLYDSR